MTLIATLTRALAVVIACAALTTPALAADEAAAQPPPIPASLVAPILSADQTPARVGYQELIRRAEDGRLRVAVVDGSSYWVAATNSQGHVLAAQIPPPEAIAGQSAADPPIFELPGFLRERGIVVLDATTIGADASAPAGGGRMSGWTRFLIFPLVIAISAALFVIGLAMFRRLRGVTGGGGGPGNVAKHNKVRASSLVEPPSTRFADVAGADEAVEELQEIVEFLRDPSRFAATGARMPRGLILYGPPGTGKTLLAKAVAGEAGVPFYAVSGSEFVESLVGVGASRVRDLFVNARKHENGTVIFLDEIDAIGRKRGAGFGGGGDSEREATLNQLLVELDGFGDRDRIVVMAATNRLELLDDALLRPGRFDRKVQVSLPAERGRREILSVHAAGKPLEDPDDLDRLAGVTAGFSGADLAKLLNEAAIMAGRAMRPTINESDLAEGMLRAVAGPERKDRALGAGELEKIAWHEAGHALTAELCPTHRKVQRVTILARGQAAGLALYGDTDAALHSPQELHERMVVAMAGRAAEQIGFGVISSGAANDLEQANRMARTAVESLGFSPEVGQIVTSVSGQPVQLAEETRQAIDAEVRQMVDRAYEEAMTLLGAHRDDLVALASALLEREQLNRSDVEQVLGGIAQPERRHRPQLIRALPTDRQATALDGVTVPAPAPASDREWSIRLQMPRRRRPTRPEDETQGEAPLGSDGRAPARTRSRRRERVSGRGLVAGAMRWIQGGRRDRAAAAREQ